MAAIKSYTDLEQSNVLATILPIESADMWWAWYSHPLSNGRYDDFPMFYKPICNPNESVPCWSLATLLELLPKRLEIVDNVYKLSVYLYGLYYWNINNGNLCFESKDKDNLVDACYEMILKLHELKML